METRGNIMHGVTLCCILSTTQLRHSNKCLMAGVDLATVRELLRHKTLTMTLRYSRLAPRHKVKAVDLLDSKLNEVCEKEVGCV